MAKDTKRLSRIASEAARKKLKGKESTKNKRRVEEIQKIPPQERTRFQDQLLKFVPRWRVLCPTCNRILGEYQYKKEVPKRFECNVSSSCGSFWSKSRIFKIQGTVVSSSGNLVDVSSQSEHDRIEFSNGDKDIIVRMAALGMTLKETADVIGVSKNSLKNLLESDHKFFARCEAAKSQIKYSLINKAFMLAEVGNDSMLKFLLRTRFGFSTQHNQGVPASQHQINSVDYSNMSVEELKTIRDILIKYEKRADGQIIDVDGVDNNGN